MKCIEIPVILKILAPDETSEGNIRMITENLEDDADPLIDSGAESTFKCLIIKLLRDSGVPEELLATTVVSADLFYNNTGGPTSIYID
ncbi:hypothetical protein [Photobacterium kishitanii]|uniref:Uncharacterized protein n=1 Tax=Photobacterium kishitanii TaxID=318456 RepID=A0A2T3KL15_9GAMM|nr:hypothetical protein [Photobacterium kishitanii]PSV00408.1 hypothetical protein C9J27_04570 [Photobacterium kishitanii]